MKTIQTFPMMRIRSWAVLVGTTIALGIVVHQCFLVVALGVILVVATEWTVQRLQEYLRDFRTFHRYP
jgi:predicted PurR-regulated permease PerM